MPPDDALAGFMIAVASGVVLGIAVMLIVYKMVDGDLPVGPGLCAMIMVLVAMALAIKAPHPVVPGLVLVLSITLMVFFPYAEQKLEEFELRRVDANRMAKSYEAVRVRPDNFAAKFELGRILHDHGFVSQAIHLTGTTIAGLDTHKDEIQNRSLKDVFHREEVLLKRWQSEPQKTNAVKCIRCGCFNKTTELFCTSCGRPYMLDIVESQEVKPRVWAKMVLAWAALAMFIPGAVAIGMNLSGIVRAVTFTGAVGAVGVLLYWLFKPPKHAPTVYGGI
jgi:hypothetical protein